MKHSEFIKPGKVVYSKKIGIIYNPFSGKKRNLRPLIEHRLKKAGIEYEFLESKKYFQTFEIANTLDID